MNFFTKLKFAIGRTAIKVANISFLPEWARAVFLNPSFTNLVNEGVRLNSAVFAVLTTLAWGFGEPRMKLRGEDGTDLVDHRIQKLLNRPNPDMSAREFNQTMLIYAAISGNGYAWIQRNNFGDPIALWPLNDSQVSVMPGRGSSEGYVRYYIVSKDGSNTTENGQIVKKEDMIHFKFVPDGINPELGYGGLQAAARDIDTDNEMGTYTFSLLKNNAIPPVVITMAQGEIVDEDVAERLRQSWKDRLGGSNRGLPAFLENGMEVKTLGSELNEAAYESLHGFPESRIAAVLRVPPILAGLKVGLDNSTYSNYAEARSAFTEDTLSPLWMAFAEVFAARLIDPESNLSLEFDISGIRSLQEDVDNLWKRAVEAFSAGLVTRAQAKIMVGIEVFEYDDVYRVSGATYFIPAGTDPDVMSGFTAGTTQTTEDDDEGILDGDVDKSLVHSKANKDTTLFAFWMPESISNYLPPISFGKTVPGENLHMTLAIVSGIVPSDVIDEVVSAAFDKVPVVTANFEDIATFNNSGAVVLTADGDTVHKFRSALVNGLLAKGYQPMTDHEFRPHVTVSYLDEGEEFGGYSYPPFTMNFESLTISTDGEQTTVKEFSKVSPLVFNKRRAEEKAARESARAFGRALQRTRFSVAGRMQAALDGYFENLADRVVAKLYQQDAKGFESKAISADDLIGDDDVEKLDALVKRFYVELAISTSETVGSALGIVLDFQLTDPLMISTMESAGVRVVGITDTTLDKLRVALKQAVELNLSVDEIARGAEGFRGIRDIVAETYKNRARTIARTELGEAQNQVTLGMYEKSGLVEEVMILDNGFEDSHETCTWIDGQIRPLEWSKSNHSGEGPSPDGVQNPLQHPNCVRTFSPYFGSKR